MKLDCKLDFKSTLRPEQVLKTLENYGPGTKYANFMRNRTQSHAI